MRMRMPMRMRVLLLWRTSSGVAQLPRTTPHAVLFARRVLCWRAGVLALAPTPSCTRVVTTPTGTPTPTPTTATQLTTAIEGEAITAALNGTNVTLVGTTNNASVTTPDVMVNASVIHLIDAVLLPTGLNLTTNATTGVDTSGFGAAGGGAAGAANGAAAGGAGAAGADMMPGGGGAAGGDAMNATSPSAAGDGASGGGAGASSGQ
jgi:hypothetical protein